MSHKVNYIIVGLGLAGSSLAWELVKRGKSVMVFDLPSQNKASAVAAGLFNPVTGKYLTKAWNADIFFPFFTNFYYDAEKKLNRKFFHLLPMFRPFVTPDERNIWRLKKETGEMQPYLLALHETPLVEDQINNPMGGIEITHSGYLDVEVWIDSIREFLMGQNAYREIHFDEGEINLGDGVVSYKDLTAEKIIFCNGMAAYHSGWFGYLPVLPLKGEVLKIKLQARLRHIPNRGVYLVPGRGENIFIAGATYHRPPFQEGNTEEARNELEQMLKELTPIPFEVVHQDWGMRPTTPDRRPLLGAHPDNNNLVVFNGLGTKGVSLAPYFANHLSDWLTGIGDLSAEVNINRFKALY